MTKTILVCSNVYPPNFVGGAELIAHYQAKALSQRGFRVIIFTGDNASTEPRYSMQRDEYGGLAVFRVSLLPDDYQLASVNFSHPRVEDHFEAVLEAFAPDVVHMHNIAGLSAGIIHRAKRRGIRTVLTLHDHWGFCYKNTLIKTGNEICRDYNRCAECLPFLSDERNDKIPIYMRHDFLSLQFREVDVFVSPSLYLAKTYVRAGFPIERMRVIWNGVDVKRFSSIIKKPRSGRVRYTFIGYLGAHKGIDVILDAMYQLQPSSTTGMLLNLVGTGDSATYLRERVESLKLSKMVRFWGRVDNARIEEVFEETDVLVLPSIWPENQPVSITEAMAARTPVIASAIGGIPELLVDGYNGYLFRPASANDLAEKMLHFMTSPNNIEKFGENGFQMMKDKSFEHQIDQICSLYEL